MAVGDDPEDELNPGEYSRRLEAYLCRKNDGHLVRIVGPAFELVCGWARTGVPFKVACQGIDRCFERHHARQPAGVRRRPVRIDFCETDVLQAFSDWRRAVGVRHTAAPSDDADDGSRASAHGTTLPAHLHRVTTRLSSLLATTAVGERLRTTLERTLEAVGALSRERAAFRGIVRQRAVTALEALDREMMDAAVAAIEEAAHRDLVRDAERQLAAFRDRMPDQEWAAAIEAAVRQLARERAGLPRVAYDG